MNECRGMEMLVSVLSDHVYSIAYSELSVVAILIALVIFYNSWKNREDRFGSGVFFALSITMVVLSISDILSWFICDDLIPHTAVFHHVVLYFYYGCQTLLACLCLVHALRAFNVRSKKAYALAVAVPMVYATALYVANFWNGLIYYLDANDGFHRAPTIWLMSFAALVPYLIGAIWSGVVFLKTKQSKVFFTKHLLINFVASFVIGVLSAAVYEINPWPLAAASLLFLSFGIESGKEKELSSLAYTDSLTHIRNATSYRVAAAEVDQRAAASDINYGVIVFDTNFLKDINDMFGHEIGDALLVASAKFICRIFAHSPVFRIGGDEFVAILEKDDFENRSMLIAEFDEGMKDVVVNLGQGKAVPINIARGFAVYQKEKMSSFNEVFAKADQAMYLNKGDLKKGRKFEDNIIVNE